MKREGTLPLRGAVLIQREWLRLFLLVICFLPRNADSIRKFYRPSDEDLDIDSFLGNWASNQSRLEEFRNKFINAKPYPHVVIDNFFAPEIASKIESRFPVPNGTVASQWIAQGWHVSLTELVYI